MFITPKVKRSLVNRHTSPMLRNRYETSPQYSVPPATPTTPIESPAPKRTPVAQALTLEETPPPSPCRSNVSTAENGRNEGLHESADDIFMDQAGSMQPKAHLVPGVVSQSAPYDDRNYDDSEEEVDADVPGDLLANESVGEKQTRLYLDQPNELNSSLDSEDLYGDVKEALTPAIVASHNIDAENSGGLEDDNIGSTSFNQEEEDKMSQQENSINAEYEIQFQNKIHGHIDDRKSESADEEEMQVDALTDIGDLMDSRQDADLSGELETSERFDLSGTDEECMEIRQEAHENWGIDTGADTWQQQQNMDRNDIEEVEEVTEDTEEVVSARVSNLSDDLARKRALLEEKRRKLLELEESYMHEFGEEEEGNLAEDLPVEDIELNDKENSSSDRNVVETVVDMHDASGAQAVGDGNREPSVVDSGAPTTNVHKEASVELIYDPVLACYFDPKSGKYYEIQS